MPHRRFKRSQPKPIISTLPDLGMGQRHLLHDFKRYYNYRLGMNEQFRSLHYAYEALSLAVSDRHIERWKKTYNAYKETNCKRAYYLSMEFLIGRRLSNAMLNLGINNAVDSAMYELGLEIEEFDGRFGFNSA
jgi:starch phosphorylase